MTNLPDARCRMYDCIEVNLASLAVRAHGPQVGLALGATLGFQPRPDATTGLPTVERPPDEEVAAVTPALGLRIDAVCERVVIDDITELATAELPLYVVGDAFYLSWVPYVGHQHMTHSYLVAPRRGRPVHDR